MTSMWCAVNSGFLPGGLNERRFSIIFTRYQFSALLIIKGTKWTHIGEVISVLMFSSKKLLNRFRLNLIWDTWYISWNLILVHILPVDRLCGLVVRVPGYRSWGTGFDSRCYQIFWEVMGLERGPLSFVRIIEELLEWKSSGSGLGNWN
jgi:hypothetical protein